MQRTKHIARATDRSGLDVTLRKSGLLGSSPNAFIKKLKSLTSFSQSRSIHGGSF